MEPLLKQREVSRYLLRYLSSFDVLHLALTNRVMRSLCEPYLKCFVLNDLSSVSSRSEYSVVHFPSGFLGDLSSLGLSSSTVRHVSSRKAINILPLVEEFPFLTTLVLNTVTLPRRFEAKSLIHFRVTECTVECDDSRKAMRPLELICPNLEVFHISAAKYAEGVDYYGQPEYVEAGVRVLLAGCPRLRCLSSKTILTVETASVPLPAVKDISIVTSYSKWTPPVLENLLTSFAPSLESVHVRTDWKGILDVLERVQTVCTRFTTIRLDSSCHYTPTTLAISSPTVRCVELSHGNYAHFTLNLAERTNLREIVLDSTILDGVVPPPSGSLVLEKLVLKNQSKISKEVQANLAEAMARGSQNTLTCLSILQCTEAYSDMRLFTTICTQLTTLELAGPGCGPQIDLTSLPKLASLKLRNLIDLTSVILPNNGALMELYALECKGLCQVDNLLNQPSLEAVTIWCCRKTPQEETKATDENEETPDDNTTTKTPTAETMLDENLFNGLFTLPHVKHLHLCTGSNILPNRVCMPELRSLNIGPHVKIPADLSSLILQCNSMLDFKIHDSVLGHKFAPEQRPWLQSVYEGTRAAKEEKRIKWGLALKIWPDDWTSALQTVIFDTSFPALSLQNAQGLINVKITSTALQYLSLRNCFNLETLVVGHAGLVELDLAGCKKIREENIVECLQTSAKTLETLFIADTPLTFPTFIHIINDFQLLKHFDWGYSLIPAEFASFSLPKNITSLKIPFLHFSPSTSLSKLSLLSTSSSSTPFPQIFSTLPQLPQLFCLSLKLSESCLAPPVDGILFSSLHTCPALSTLFLDVTSLSPQIIPNLCMAMLSSVSSSIEDFTLASKPSLTPEVTAECTDSSAAPLTCKLPRLRKCRLLNCSAINGENVAAIIRAAPVLKVLYLDGCTGISLLGFEHIKESVTRVRHEKELDPAAAPAERKKRGYFLWRKEGYAVWDLFEPYAIDKFTFDATCTQLRKLSVANCGPMFVSTANALSSVLDKFVISEESRSHHREALSLYEKPLVCQWADLDKKAHERMHEEATRSHYKVGLYRPNPPYLVNPEPVSTAMINKCVFVYIAPPPTPRPPPEKPPTKTSSKADKKRRSKPNPKSNSTPAAFSSLGSIWSFFSSKPVPPPEPTPQPAPEPEEKPEPPTPKPEPEPATTVAEPTSTTSSSSTTSETKPPKADISPLAPADGRHITKRLQAQTQLLEDDAFLHPIIGMKSSIDNRYY
ncbi:hypothetical protein Pelo_13358 [Pelomyxa schiedti]|nr:hypothetical protein Pelo_13358 [Pelomyxa schiedti]